MKKSLLRIPILLFTFSIGITIFETFNLDKKLETDIEIQNIKPIFFQENETSKGQLVVIDKSIPEEDFLTDENADKDNFNGWYSLDHHSKSMKEVIMIALSKDVNEKPESYGGVFTTLENYGDQGHFSSSKALIKGNKATFRTEKIKGIEYSFEGTFFKEKIPKNEAGKVLHGTLRKFVNGKKVAQTTGNFGYYEPQCWH